MTMTMNGRDRLADARESTREARSTRQRAEDALKAAQQEGNERAEAVAQMAVQDARYRVGVAEEIESALLRQMSGMSAFDQTFLDDPAQVATLERLASTSSNFDSMQFGALSSVDALVESINSGSWGQPKMGAAVVPDSVVGRRGPFSELGFVQQPRRRIRLLDLIPTSPAIGNTIPYIVESGSFDTASETQEAQLKPTGDVGLTDEEAPIRTIAHFLKSPRQILADVPGLEQILRNRLQYGVLRRVENQLVSGDGTGQDLTGILNTTGIGGVAYASATPLGDLSLEGLVEVLNAEGEPDAAVMNATTLASLLTPKATSSGVYLNSDGPFGSGLANLTLWGIPVIVSSVMPNGQVLFGAFAEGAHLWVREAVNVVIGLDSDDFTRNKVTLLGEGRFGLTINVPSYFTLVHLA